MSEDVTLKLKTKKLMLEFFSRAHLHACLETLKAVVPLQLNTSRHTTLGLLISARRLIKVEQLECITLCTS